MTDFAKTYAQMLEQGAAMARATYGLRRPNASEAMG